MTNGVVDWSFDYTVPVGRGIANPENIVFYYVGNAVNGSGTGNDYVRDGITGVALPIELLSFQIKKIASGKIHLNWITALEVNSASFEIEHSTDGINFERIGNKTAAGNSFSNETYDFIHSNPAIGNNFYRLKLLDRDETFRYSSTELLNLEKTNLELVMYPNPTTDILYINNLDKSLNQVTVINSQGQALKNIQLNEGQNILSLEELSPGNYFLRYKEGASMTMKPFIKL